MTTYYVDGAVGNDSNAGTSEGAGNAWLTINKAITTIVAGDICWVKASATYAETGLTLSNAGTSSNHIWLRGYTTTTGDNGKVTIDCTGSSNGLIIVNSANYWVIENFIIDGSNGTGVLASLGDYLRMNNCEISNHASDGIRMDNFLDLVNCEVTNNGGGAVDMDDYGVFVGCIFNNNTKSPFSDGCRFTRAYKCLIYGNGSTAGWDGPLIWSDFIASTFDLDGNNRTFSPLKFTSPALCLDNIIHDIGTNVTAIDEPASLRFITRNNLFSSLSGADYTDDTLGYGEDVSNANDTTADANFTNEAGDDYRPSSSSPAVDAQLKPGGIT